MEVTPCNFFINSKTGTKAVRFTFLLSSNLLTFPDTNNVYVIFKASRKFAYIRKSFDVIFLLEI